ncbi:hypothetical protein [Nocardioides dongkuii]|uniref:hypothetical protein n=1 Tax=Nocardioides dongkuii TaxID=2760089 RepID=UPI0015F99293|nr:hypothetical protein [Nocardioides dongkuii]
MPDQLRDLARSAAGQVVAIVVLFAVLGVLAGLVWYAVWDAPTGVVSQGEWFPSPYDEGQRADFSGTALYVLVALVTGLVGGAVSALLLARHELVTVAAVVVGSCLAALLMFVVGTALGPPDPSELARSASDGTELEGHLHVSGASPFTALPFGALLALIVVFLGTAGRRER